MKAQPPGFMVGVGLENSTPSARLLKIRVQVGWASNVIIIICRSSVHIWHPVANEFNC